MTTPLPELPCADFVEVITDYLENRLGADDTQRFEEHLGECEDCATYLEQMRATVGALGGLDLASLDPALVTELTAVCARFRE